MTPFESYGYTKDTVFRVVEAAPRFPVGTQVKLLADDGTDMPYFTNGSVYGFVKLHHLEYVSGPRNITMNHEELTALINDILDAREGLPTIPPEFTRWRGGDCPVSEDTQVEVILRNGDRLSRSAGSLDWDDDDHLRDIIAYRVLTDARAVEARELRAWFNEHAPTKFKQGDMVVCGGRVCIVCGVAPHNEVRKYLVSNQDFYRYVKEAELTPYEEGK